MAKNLTVRFNPELHSLLAERAEYHHRSMSQEVIYLVECALAAEIEGNIDIVRTLMMAQGGLKSVRTATGESQLAS